MDPAEPARLPRRIPAADHRRLRRSELRRLPPVQEGPGRLRRRVRTDHHRPALSTRNIEVEQSRAPPVLPHHPQPARTAPDQLRNTAQEHLGQPHQHQTYRQRRPRRERLPHGPYAHQGRARGDPPAHPAGRLPRGVELHHRPLRSPDGTATRAGPGEGTADPGRGHPPAHAPRPDRHVPRAVRPARGGTRTLSPGPGRGGAGEEEGPQPARIQPRVRLPRPPPPRPGRRPEPPQHHHPHPDGPTARPGPQHPELPRPPDHAPAGLRRGPRDHHSVVPIRVFYRPWG